MRLRAEYSVGAELKFLSNLDMMHLMERALRRAAIPYALSEGFNPHIKLSMGTVLPVGLWSIREYFDLELKEKLDVGDFMQRMNQVLPQAMSVVRCKDISPEAPSLMKVINAACYSFVIRNSSKDLYEWSRDFMAEESLLVKSRGKKKDVDKELRPGIYNVEVQDESGFATIKIWVSTGEPVNVRYDELVDILIKTGISEADIADVYRSGNFIKEGHRFYSPLEKVI